MQTAVLTKVTRQGQITLPAAIRRALQIEEGDYIEVSIVNDSMILTPKRLIDKSQAYFWTPEWQAAEDEADEDIAAGRIYKFGDADSAIAALRESQPDSK